MNKKKILFHSNYSRSKTGFGRNSKEILKYLFKTGKYEIIEYAMGLPYSHESLKSLPWKAYGSIPDSDLEWNKIQKDPNHAKAVQYGSRYIDEIIEKEKPDIWIGAEDIWAFTKYWERPWFKKINSIFHTPIDSLPILPMAIEAAQNTKYFYGWADFASEELNRMGINHAKTIYGAFDTSQFIKLPDDKRQEIRQKNNIPQDAFIIGYVFRNQLRKSVPNLLTAFKDFSEKYPNSYLLLHTHWAENPNNSWDIPRYIRNLNIDPSKILTTYICRSCKEYEIKNYAGQNIQCKYCGSENGQITANVSFGVSEEQLNEVYNLMDVYCHPFTSGGQEMPIQEAKLTELITLCTNYVCGTKHCTPESGGLPLEWSSYFEPATQFIKATTLPSSIFKQLEKVYKMPKSKKEEIGKQARKYILERYDTQVVGKQWENILDNMPDVNWDYDMSPPAKNPDYCPSDNSNDLEWIKELYENILFLDLPDNDKGVLHWIQKLKEGAPREKVLEYFRQVAVKDNKKQEKISLSDLLKDDKGKKIAFVMPESAGDVYMTTSLLSGLKNLYKEYNIYYITKPQFFPILEGNPHIHKIIPYFPESENLLWMEGAGKHKGFFDICFLPHIGTQRVLNYLHNGEDKKEFEIKE